MMKLLIPILFFGLWSAGCNDAPAGTKTPAATKAATVSTAPKAASNQEEFDFDYLMGHFDPAKHPDFSKIETPFADRAGMFLRKDTYEAFKKMHNAAQKEGISLKIISAARNFDAQKGIWEAKWNGSRILSNGQNAAKAYPVAKDRALKILEYSAMPGASRHHWGTDIDLNNLSDQWFQQGEGKKIYTWLVKNAGNFGFCQPYSAKNELRPEGYNEEKWHWSYMPISKKLTTLAQTKMKDSMITGFSGAETATEIGVVEKYVLGINQQCQ
jgi:LAS superfamily LD-carboxypeptidase LdcB